MFCFLAETGVKKSPIGQTRNGFEHRTETTTLDEQKTIHIKHGDTNDTELCKANRWVEKRWKVCAIFTSGSRETKSTLSYNTNTVARC